MICKRLHVIGLLFAVAASTTVAAAPTSDPAALTFFETRIRPLLSERCFECHGPDKQKAGLRLDHRQFILKGGDTGPALVPGHPDRSRLIEGIGYANVDFQMPPKGKLDDAQIADLTKWVAMGAPWPDEPLPDPAEAEQPFDIAQRVAEHWAWQIQPHTPPAVQDKNWPRNPIDRFILARLEAKELTPAGNADRRTLIRRLYFDLVGLPPTAEQVRAFVNDSDPHAYETLVDRLLASPHFGEKWARHWMDLVRYAESYGHEFDYPIFNAWKYRDYLIRAFNADVPYDQFVREHVAGDLLDQPRLHPTDNTNESIIATGAWLLHEQTHGPVDSRQHLADRVDNMIDVMSKTFLGLTVACARCHDHKFDAIGTKDYYAFAGVFHSSRLQRAWLEPGNGITGPAGQLERMYEQHRSLLRDHAAGQPAVPPMREGDVLFEDFAGSDFTGWYPTGWAFGAKPAQVGDWAFDVPSPAANTASVAHSGLLSPKLRGALRSPTFEIANKAIHVRVAGKGRIRVVIDNYMMDQHSALLFRGLIQEVDSPGRFRWVSIRGALPNYLGHRAYLEILDNGDGAIVVDRIVFNDAGPPPGESSPVAEPVMVAGELADRLASARRQMQAIGKALPVPEQVLALADGTGIDEPIYIRGKHQTPGDIAPRAMLEAIAGPDQPPMPSDTSGRLTLARRILDPANPFPARVQVNRIWHHLFGRGIVPTVDNFGVLGQKPIHPELLDWLAHRFRSTGWSNKQLIRLIVTSSTYRMTSVADPEAVRVDPQNTLLHHMPVRRLQAEAIRDAMLAVSGELDETLGGPPVPIHLTPFMQGRGRPKQSGPLDGAGRRSIYIAVRRNFLSPMMLAFDMPVPFSAMGRRTISNVPAQALILMNDPFVVAQAKAWAENALDDHADFERRIVAMYEAAFARPPRSDEIATAQEFMTRQAKLYGLSTDAGRDDPRVWADFAHVLFNVKEFIFLR